MTPQIETPRLLLKAVQNEDAEDIYSYVRNPKVLRHTPGRTPREFSETQTFVRGLVNKPKGAFAWAMRMKGHTEVIGVVEFGMNEDGAMGSVGYAMSEDYWNQGIMTETIIAVLGWAFQNLSSLQCVQSTARTANPASTRVQQKCGMSLVRRDHRKWDKFEEPVELAVCMITREEWMTANNRVAGGISPPAPTPPSMRVRTRRFT
jgi:ribosomal-protein-alanine N-acetyltransferase